MDDALCMDTELLAELGLKLQQISAVLRSMEVPVGAQGNVELHCPAPRLVRAALVHDRLDDALVSYRKAIGAYADSLQLLSSHVLEAAVRFDEGERRLLLESGEMRLNLFADWAGAYGSWSGNFFETPVKG